MVKTVCTVATASLHARPSPHRSSSTMASQIPGDNSDCYKVSSFIQGYHAYHYLLNPSVGQVLRLRREPHNSHDRHAVAVVKSGKSGDTAVGHVPYNLEPIFSHFLATEFNKGTVYITRERTDWGAGHVPCTYHLYGPKAFVDCLKQKVESSRKGSCTKFF